MPNRSVHTEAHRRDCSVRYRKRPPQIAATAHTIAIKSMFYRITEQDTTATAYYDFRLLV